MMVVLNPQTLVASTPRPGYPRSMNRPPAPSYGSGQSRPRPLSSKMRGVWKLYFDGEEQPSRTRRSSIPSSEGSLCLAARAPSRTGQITSRNAPYQQTIIEGVPTRFHTSKNMEDDAVFTDRRRSSGELGLPPIGRRPPSSHSQRSGRSRPSSGNLSRGSVVKYEKPLMISLDTPADPKSKRSHVSPTSTTGSNQTGSGSSHPEKMANSPFLKFRAKSWCATVNNAGPNPKLETLAERTVNGLAKPHTRKLSNNSSTLNSSSLIRCKRAKSYGNLTKLSDGSSKNFSSNVTHKGTSNLSRFGSDQNLSRANSIGSHQQSYTARVPVNGRQRTMVEIASKSKGLRQSQSQPTMSRPGAIRQGTVIEVVHHPDEYQDPEKKERIIEWLIGVQESAEIPVQEPTISEDAPKQTDTAIHIVYDGD